MKPSAALEDMALIQLINNGDFEAFNILYDRYINMVYRRIAMLIPVADIEDVTQEVFISVLKSIKHYRQESKFSTWLTTITKRRIADYYRQRKPGNQQNHNENADLESDEKNQNDPSVDFDTIIILQQTIKQLPEDQQEILLLRFVDGLQFGEIADLLAISLDAAKSRFRRAVDLVRLGMVKE